MSRSLVVLLGLFGLASLAPYAARAADSVRFSEYLVHRPTPTGGDYTAGRTALTAVVSLAGTAIDGFNADTPVEIRAGDFHFSGTLGTDPHYVPGRRVALFRTRDAGPLGRTISAITLSWNAKLLIVRISAATPDSFTPVRAGTVIASAGAVNSTTAASLHFGPVKDEFLLSVKGAVAARSVTVDGEVIRSATALLAGRSTAGEAADTHLVGEGSFHVDAQTGDVTVGADSSAASGVHTNSVVLQDSAVRFSSSTLLDQPGDPGRRLLNVSFTNRSGESIGLLPGGTETGMKVLLSPITSVGAFTSAASQVLVSTLAGSGTEGESNGPAATATFTTPISAVADSTGSVYVSQWFLNDIRKISGDRVSTFVGGGNVSRDGLGTGAGVRAPFGMAFNPTDGALIVAEMFGAKVRRITADGRATTIAGKGTDGHANGAGNLATFSEVRFVAVSQDGVIYATDSHAVRKIVLTNEADPSFAASYRVSTLAGGTVSGFDDGAGTAARFNKPRGIAVDTDGFIYVADTMNNAIRRISPDGLVGTIAGFATAGAADGSGHVASFNSPQGVAIVNHAVVVADTQNNKLRQLTLTEGGSPSSRDGWQIVTLAGTGVAGALNGTGDLATFKSPVGLNTDGSGILYCVDNSGNRVRKLVPINTTFPVGVPSGTLSFESVQLANADGVIPNGDLPYFNYPGSLAPGAGTAPREWQFIIPGTVSAFEFTARVEANTRLPLPAAAVSNPGPGGAGSPGVHVRTLAGASNGDTGYFNGIPTQARFHSALGLALDAAGNLYVADAGNNAIRRMSAAGRITTVAGVLGSGPGANDGTGAVAKFSGPTGVVVSDDGTELFVSDSGTRTVRRIVLLGDDPADPGAWFVSTIAGGGGGAADGPGNAATFVDLAGIARDSTGNLFVTEATGNRVRRLEFKAGDRNLAANWQVSLVAGDNSTAIGATGSTNAVGAGARFSSPHGIAVDRAGNLYVADTSNHQIRMITGPGGGSGGAVTTFAGLGVGYVDGTAGVRDATPAKFNAPFGVTVDSAGYLFVADTLNQRIRRVGPDGIVSTVAGNGDNELVDGTGDVAAFEDPTGIVVDGAGTLYVTDGALQERIRLIQRLISVGAP
ncbi:MAG TPA: hypothetical protein VGO11_27985 [Chthoniobacteraceae bacterium]|jgi:sugar lactone lactonase YvrE|nr:hypothetical protein [Chthoniobacteraceae bacterium]